MRPIPKPIRMAMRTSFFIGVSSEVVIEFRLEFNSVEAVMSRKI